MLQNRGISNIADEIHTCWLRCESTFTKVPTTTVLAMFIEINYVASYAVGDTYTCPISVIMGICLCCNSFKTYH